MDDKFPRVVCNTIFERLEQKLDKLDARLDDANIIQAEIRADLNYHIKRTDMLEEHIRPIERHVIMLNSVFRFLTIAATIVAIVGGIFSLIKFV